MHTSQATFTQNTGNVYFNNLPYTSVENTTPGANTNAYGNLSHNTTMEPMGRTTAVQAGATTVNSMATSYDNRSSFRLRIDTHALTNAPSLHSAELTGSDSSLSIDSDSSVGQYIPRTSICYSQAQTTVSEANATLSASQDPSRASRVFDALESLCPDIAASLRELSNQAANVPQGDAAWSTRMVSQPPRLISPSANISPKFYSPGADSASLSNASFSSDNAPAVVDATQQFQSPPPGVGVFGVVDPSLAELQQSTPVRYDNNYRPIPAHQHQDRSGYQPMHNQAFANMMNAASSQAQIPVYTQGASQAAQILQPNFGREPIVSMPPVMNAAPFCGTPAGIVAHTENQLGLYNVSRLQNPTVSVDLRSASNQAGIDPTYFASVGSSSRTTGIAQQYQSPPHDAVLAGPVGPSSNYDAAQGYGNGGSSSEITFIHESPVYTGMQPTIQPPAPLPPSAFGYPPMLSKDKQTLRLPSGKVATKKKCQKPRKKNTPYPLSSQEENTSGAASRIPPTRRRGHKQKNDVRPQFDAIEWLYDNRDACTSLQCPVCKEIVKQTTQGTRHILTHSRLGAVYCPCAKDKHFSRVDSFLRHAKKDEIADEVPPVTICRIRRVQAEIEEKQFTHLLTLLKKVPSKEDAEYYMLHNIIVEFRFACQRAGQKLDLDDKDAVEQRKMDEAYIDFIYKQYPYKNSFVGKFFASPALVEDDATVRNDSRSESLVEN